MSHSLRAKIKGLRYKGIITEKDCDRICKALDNEDVLNKIRTEIEDYITHSPYVKSFMDCCRLRDDVMRIIDKYKAE